MSAGTDRVYAALTDARRSYEAAVRDLKAAEGRVAVERERLSQADLDYWHAEMIQYACPLCPAGVDEPCPDLPGRQVHTARGIEPARRSA